MKARFIYRNLKARFRDQRREIKALLGRIRPGDTVVDCGANKGSYVWTLSRAVGPGGRVIAFEPQPSLARYLQEAAARCALANVTVENKVVSDASGPMELFVPGGGVSPGASVESAVRDREACETVAATAVTLDEYFQDSDGRVSALKIDVEGHELAVFRGSERLLETYSPLLVFECEQRHLTGHTVADVLSWLRARGYDGWFVHRGALRPVSRFDPAVHQAMVGDRFWDRAGYCNNFIMTRDPSLARERL